jgi:hypothetical protein
VAHSTVVSARAGSDEFAKKRAIIPNSKIIKVIASKQTAAEADRWLAFARPSQSRYIPSR